MGEREPYQNPQPLLPRATDLTRCWEDRQKGFAAAADMIGKLLTAWEEASAERDALALRVANLERIGREIVDVADQEKLPAFSCFQDMNDALKSTGTGAGLREIVERAVRAGYDFGRENSTRITGPTREEFGPAPALPSSSSDLERARAWLEANTRHMGFYEPAIASLAAEFSAIRRDASATNAAERALFVALGAWRAERENDYPEGQPQRMVRDTADDRLIAAYDACRSLAGRDARETPDE